MILVELQSIWSMNIIMHALMCLIQTYHEYFERENGKLCSSK